MDQPFELQKQKHEISEPGEASVPIEPQEIKDSDSARSIISKLSEDNEVEHADPNALKKWLAKSKQQLAKFFTTQTLSDSSKSDSKVQGPYKTKRSVQLLHTQQHHAKLSWDWTLKMQNKGYNDLGNFFSWYKFLERKQAPNPSPKPPRETNPAEDHDFGPQTQSESIDDDNPIIVLPDPTPEDEEDNLGALPKLHSVLEPLPQWMPTQQRPTPPPSPTAVDYTIHKIGEILHPK